MPGRNTVQSVGNSTYTFTHALINTGQAVNIQGIKLDTQFLKARQMVDNSKVVLLVNGSAITLTNVARSGSFTLSVVDNGDTAENGNFVEIARALQQSGDSFGGELRIATLVNGVTKAITLLGITLKVFDLILLAGNDVPEYPVEFNYQDWAFS